MKKNKFTSIESIIKSAKNGEMYILVDDENRENEGDLVFCASDVTANKINFMAKYGRGLICLALNSFQAKRLNLNYMSPVNKSRNQTAFTVSIESKKGVTTGISAKDRARTIKVATKKNVKKNITLNYLVVILQIQKIFLFLNIDLKNLLRMLLEVQLKETMLLMMK